MTYSFNFVGKDGNNYSIPLIDPKADLENVSASKIEAFNEISELLDQSKKETSETISASIGQKLFRSIVSYIVDGLNETYPELLADCVSSFGEVNQKGRDRALKLINMNAKQLIETFWLSLGDGSQSTDQTEKKKRGRPFKKA